MIVILATVQLWNGGMAPIWALNNSDSNIHVTYDYDTSSTSSTPTSTTSSASSHSSSYYDSSCPYKFKVYVYPLPFSLGSVKVGFEARRNRTLHICQKCILEQFSLEYIIEDFIVNTCARTLDPSEADFFYLPLLRDAEFRMKMSIKSKDSRGPSETEMALLDILEKNDSRAFQRVFNISSPNLSYWNRYNGADHIIVMPAPVTNLKHETSQRGFFHYRRQLYSPIFLALEYSKSFIETFPICSKQKNILVPYPTTDPDLFTGKLHSFNVSRNSLIYYAGGVHGDCIEIRKAMKFLVLNSTSLPSVIAPIPSSMQHREHGFSAAIFCPIPVGDSPSSKRMYDVLNFGCIPVVVSDDLVWAYSINAGGTLDPNKYSITIPQICVQLSASALLNRYSEFKEKLGVLPVSRTRIYDILMHSHLSGGEYWGNTYVNPLVQILMRIPKEDIVFLQKGVIAAAPHFRYYAMTKKMVIMKMVEKKKGGDNHNDDDAMVDIPTAVHRYPDGGAMHTIAYQLEKRLELGIEEIATKCEAERTRKRPNHEFEWRYPCDRNAGDGRPTNLKRL